MRALTSVSPHVLLEIVGDGKTFAYKQYKYNTILTSYFPMLLKNIMLTDPNSFRNNHLPEPE